MKNIKPNNKFTSVIALKKIKVLHVVCDPNGDHKHDLIGVADLDKNNRVIKKTKRVVYADSIRRRYSV